MTPTRTPARSAVARFYPSLHHPHLYALLILVVTALVVTLGTRPAAPDATAATDKTFETDDHIVTQAQNGTITIIDKKTQIAVQDTVDPAAQGPPEEELAALANGLHHQFKNNLGWDLETDTDRTRLLNETRALTHQLHNIPEATLNLKDNAALRTLRDTFDETNGTKNCRERCLITETIKTMITGIGLARNLRVMKSYLAQGGQLETLEAALGIVVIVTNLVAFWYMLERDLRNMPELFKLMIRVVMVKILEEVHKVIDDTVDYVAHSRTTMRQAVTDAAQHIDTLTPDDAPATDYDLAKDEL